MNRKGFTLIELLIVVVIIGILAAIAIPKFANTKEKAYLASMKSDLRNLITAEEAYFADSVKYTQQPRYRCTTLTSGVAGPTITTTADGFTATVSAYHDHEDLRGVRRFDVAGAGQQGRRAEVRLRHSGLTASEGGGGDPAALCAPNWARRSQSAVTPSAPRAIVVAMAYRLTRPSRA